MRSRLDGIERADNRLSGVAAVVTIRGRNLRPSGCATVSEKVTVLMDRSR